MTKTNSDIASKLGNVGGRTTLKRHGVEHYRNMANKRWNNERAKKEIKEDKPSFLNRILKSKTPKTNE